jgi:hypothetical protein
VQFCVAIESKIASTNGRQTCKHEAAVGVECGMSE